MAQFVNQNGASGFVIRDASNPILASTGDVGRTDVIVAEALALRAGL